MTLVATLTRNLSSVFRLGVDLEVPPGITILFGPSGSGKSTVLRCLAGLTRADAGRITLNEHVLFDSARRVDLPPQRRHVGLVFQQLALHSQCGRRYERNSDQPSRLCSWLHSGIWGRLTMVQIFNGSDVDRFESRCQQTFVRRRRRPKTTQKKAVVHYA